MAFSYAFRAEVGHKADFPASCAREHGHTLTARVTFRLTSTALHSEAIERVEPLIRACDGLAAELAGRSLNDMIAPSSPDAIGAALWIVQRLPFDLKEVTVEYAGLAATWDDQ